MKLHPAEHIIEGRRRMYRILCYGDSNTWGFNPINGLRFHERERWPGVLRYSLGSGFEIIEDGQNGREVRGVSGTFTDTLHENEPLDVIIIFLGINDICFEKDVKVCDVIEGIRKIIKAVGDYNSDEDALRPEIILIGATPINQTQVEDRFFELEAEKVRKYGEELRKLAGSEGCGFIDSGKIIHSSEHDGIHLEAGEHEKLGLFVSDYVRTFLRSSNLQNSF